jgi:hypothetical protein
MISLRFPILRNGSITALVGREVKRTFSASGGFCAGLSGQDTLEAVGQNGGDFGYPFVWSLVHAGHSKTDGKSRVYSNQPSAHCRALSRRHLVISDLRLCAKPCFAVQMTGPD